MNIKNSFLILIYFYIIYIFQVATNYVNSHTDDNATALHYAGQIAKSVVPIDEPDADRKVVHYIVEGGGNVDLVTKQVILIQVFNTCISCAAVSTLITLSEYINYFEV